MNPFQKTLTTPSNNKMKKHSERIEAAYPFRIFFGLILDHQGVSGPTRDVCSELHAAGPFYFLTVWDSRKSASELDWPWQVHQRVAESVKDIFNRHKVAKKQVKH